MPQLCLRAQNSVRQFSLHSQASHEATDLICIVVNVCMLVLLWVMPSFPWHECVHGATLPPKQEAGKGYKRRVPRLFSFSELLRFLYAVCFLLLRSLYFIKLFTTLYRYSLKAAVKFESDQSSVWSLDSQLAVKWSDQVNELVSTLSTKWK